MCQSIRARKLSGWFKICQSRFGVVHNNSICKPSVPKLCVLCPIIDSHPQFFISLHSSPWLDGHYHALGRVCKGLKVPSTIVTQFSSYVISDTEECCQDGTQEKQRTGCEQMFLSLECNWFAFETSLTSF